MLCPVSPIEPSKESKLEKQTSIFMKTEKLFSLTQKSDFFHQKKNIIKHLGWVKSIWFGKGLLCIRQTVVSMR